MLKIKPMRPRDFTFAAKLANTMDWNMAPQDFQFASILEPSGCFVAYLDSEPVGIATCISYGGVGWFGNLIVKENCRRHGVGSQLVRHAINYLQSVGVKTVGLYAYPQLVDFYGMLGFRQDEAFSVWHNPELVCLPAQTLPKIGKRQLALVETFDSQFFGGDRRKLLETIIFEKGNLSFFLKETETIVGFVAATVYESTAWVGPLICKPDREDAAISLLKATLAKLTCKKVYMVAPKKEVELTNLLVKIGFTVDFTVYRMFFGEKNMKNCIYVAESLERG